MNCFRQFEKEKEQALKIQWEKAETIKEQAVEGAIGSLRKKMKDEYALEKEKAIAETLTSARASIIVLAYMIKSISYRPHPKGKR